MSSSNPDIHVTQNYLLVDGQMLRQHETDPDDLQWILTLGRKAILDGIMDFYLRTKAQNPDATVEHPSINLLHLGRDMKRTPVLSELGRNKGTGLYIDEEQVSERIRPYFHAIARAAFLPEVRAWGGDTFGLLLRDEPYSD